MTFRADVRAACISLLEGYKAAVNAQRVIDMNDKPFVLQIYPGRPRTINPPTAFVDRIYESIVYTGPELVQRTTRADIVVLYGQFDSAEAVAQADAFVDGFLDYVTGLVHEAGPNTTVGITEAEDLPTFVNEWVAPTEQRSYFGTRYTLEGFAES